MDVALQRGWQSGNHLGPDTFQSQELKSTSVVQELKSKHWIWMIALWADQSKLAFPPYQNFPFQQTSTNMSSSRTLHQEIQHDLNENQCSMNDSHPSQNQHCKVD